MKLMEEDGSISSELKLWIENTNDLMFVKNRQYVYVASSKSYALDCVRCDSVEEVIGRTDFELFEDQSIAEKYRADDERLFAADKPMTVFQEEYPDHNGKKHRCLTTKYLLHDRHGKAVAILGQYHDIEEQIENEIEQRRLMEHKISKALNKMFYASYFLDLKTDSYAILQGEEYAKKAFANCISIRDLVDSFLTQLVCSEDRERMREFCDLETLSDRLSDRTHIDCEYRGVFIDGWCQASFLPVDRDEKGVLTHVLFVLSTVDLNRAKTLDEGISARKNLEQIHIDRLHTLEKSNEDAMCICDVNVTQNSFSNVQATGIIKECGEKAKSLDEFLYMTSLAVLDPDEQELYRSMFQRDALIKQFEQGESKISLEHFYRLDEMNTTVVETVVELLRDPQSGDIIGVAYAKDRNASILSDYFLKTALDKDYMRAALLYPDTEEYYLFELDQSEYCTHKQKYWDGVYERLEGSVDAQEMQSIRANLNGEKVVGYLRDHEEYPYAFYGSYRGKRCRLEAKYAYVDKKHHLMLASLRNITDEDLYRQYKYESEHDPLTGLYNRKAVFAKCRELLYAYPDEQFVMAHVDMKHFRLFNTFFSDEAGDKLLCDIAEMFRALSKEYDHWAYGRIEGDVFCAFFPYDRQKYTRHITEIIKALKNYRSDFLIEPKVGMYMVMDPSLSIESMFTRATLASKEVRPNTVNATAMYDERLEKELTAQQQITGEMQTAIEQEQFEVYLQPKYSLHSEKLTGAEALVRWRHPEKGMISPGLFIPIFESNGFIAELDRYMWEHVCQILQKWQNEGKPMYPVSVNISRVSMYSQETVPFLKSLVKKYDLDPRILELELTESAYMDDPADLKRMLKELQEYGFKILMDDFGSGYSSLNTLRELPVNVLKLDMKFLSDSQYDVRGNAVLYSVVRMSKLLHLPIVAEGVEKKEQADYLRSIGCEYVQGFLFAKPMPVREYEQLLPEGEAAIEPEFVEESMEGEAVNQKGYEAMARKLAELQEENAVLRHRLSFLGNAVDNMPNPIFMKGSDGRFVFFNQKYAECFGMDREKHIGETVLDLDYLPMEDRRKYHEEDLNLIRTGQISSYSKDYVFSDGRTHPSFYWSKGFICPDNGEHGLVGEIVDITDERKLSDDLGMILKGTAYLFDQFYVVDLKSGRYTSIARNEEDRLVESQRAEGFFKKALGRFYHPLNKHLIDYCFEADSLRELLKDVDDYYMECMDAQQEGSIFGTTIHCVERKDGIPCKVVYAIHDITDSKLDEQEYHHQLKRANERLKDLANLDSMTGLYNRRGLMEVVNTQFTPELKVAMLLIDVDQFKSVNDTYGHVAGDKLLTRTAELLRSTFRSKDILARLGGDEFMVILMDCDREHGSFIPEKIRKINEELMQGTSEIPAGSLSVGVAFSRPNETQQLYNRADAALYRVKENGRCGCCVYEEEIEKDPIGTNH